VQQSDGDFELNVSSGTIDIGDFMRKMGSAGQGGRVERRKMKVKDCYPILQSAELERKLAGLDIKREAIELAEQNGIVFIDEIDKIVSDSSKYSSDASAEGVQRDLLPLIEGSNVDTKRYGNVKTDHVLFVASGAFHECKPSDMLAELQGRLPIRVQLQGLTAEDMQRILTEPEFNIVEQQVALISAEGVTLNFTPDAITAIANLASEINRTVENIGARRLHTVIERIMEDISFDAAEMEAGSVVEVGEDLVREKLGDMVKKTDLSKFIL
jgi:ATP-dependent HslUV protease ATP-binding subunit HslU